MIRRTYMIMFILLFSVNSFAENYPNLPAEVHEARIKIKNILVIFLIFDLKANFINYFFL